MAYTPDKSGFPDQFASDEKKASLEYGLRVGRAIENEWFRRDGGGSRFYNNRDNYHKLRSYAMGEQSTAKYKKEMAVNGDISYLNLDWTPVPIIPKFVDIVKNGISNRMFDIKVEAVDPISSNKRALYKNKIETQMRFKDSMMQAQNALGKNMFSMDPDSLPSSGDELDLHVMLEYKDDIEIAEEKAIEVVFNNNNFSQVKSRLDEDVISIGIQAARHSFNRNDGIKIDYVDPANLVYSPTDDPKFEDCYYFGEIKNINITELKKINPNLTKEDIKKIQQQAGDWDAYQGHIRNYNATNATFDKNTVNVLFFCYKTDKNIVYKKKVTAVGTEKVIKKDDSFNPEENENFQRLSKRIDVWYEGVLVLGTDNLLKWDLMKNMVRPKSSIDRVYAPFVVSAPKMYRGSIDSLVKRMIPFADQIQLIHLKLQQVTSKMIPDGVYLDIDGLSSINLGNGASYTPQEALNLYFQTGSVIGRSYNEEGEYNHGKIPVQELTSSGANAKISSLINMYNYNLNMIRSATGLNEARDGSMPDSNALVGVQKLAALNSNTATRHILESGLFVTKRLAECVSYRVSDLLEYSDMAEDFVSAIGRSSTELLTEISELHLHDFGIYIELHPDEDEKASLEQNIQVCLAAGQLDIDDAIDIRSVKNTKIASQLLKVRKQRKEREMEQRKQQNIALQAEANQQAAMQAEQAKQQTLMAEGEMKAKIIQMEAQFDIEKMQVEYELKSKLVQLQGQIDSGKKEVENKLIMDKEAYKEDRKDARTEKQASQQSQLIQQRQQSSEPMDFEQKLAQSLGMGQQM